MFFIHVLEITDFLVPLLDYTNRITQCCNFKLHNKNTKIRNANSISGILIKNQFVAKYNLLIQGPIE